MATLKRNCVKAVLSALTAHLRANMPNVAEFSEEFPSANVALKYPMVTITTGNPVFTPLEPTVLFQGPTGLDNKAQVQRIVGMYDLQMQVDIWCRNKVERINMFEEFFQAFNQEIDPMGLSLKLDDYFGVFCRYDSIGHDLADGEQASQTDEWRARINLLVNTRAVLERREYVMVTIENNISTPDNIP